jgi:rhodanese-related sulfurtransferase
MGFFDFLRGPGIDEGIKECRETCGAVLLDVRTRQEYQEGHIPGSKNVPLQELNRMRDAVAEKDTPLFVYCHSGARSRQAVGELQRMGYLHVKNIGGIAAYTGKVERI